MKRRLLVALLLAVAALTGGVVGWCAREPAPADPAATLAERYGADLVLDRHGEPLRLANGPFRARALPPGPLPERLVTATLVSEDQRYWQHPGVDAPAVIRTLWSSARAGRLVSGASTLTMQLARMMRPARRTLGAKLREAWWALQLDRAHDKRALLRLYLSYAPYGGLVRGAEQAAWQWLGKPAAALSWAEAAWIAVLPRAPTAMNPARRPRAAIRAQRRLLRRLHAAGAFDADALQVALDQPIAVLRHQPPFAAAHLADRIVARHGRAGATWHTTLDAGLQRRLEGLTAEHVARAGHLGVRNAAVVVLDVATSEVRALVGSQGWQDRARGGANDGSAALRQPGSTLKPFLYALAAQDGLTLTDPLFDIETHFATPDGDWRPDNYGRRTHGPVLAREALARSLNIPAVRLLERTGVARLQALLRAAGLSALDRAPEHYGLGLALGGGEVTLLQLATAWRALAALGRARPARFIRRATWATGAEWRPAASQERRVLAAEAVWPVLDALRDPRWRRAAFPAGGPLDGPWGAACKTGTSKGYRDNWTVCVTSAHVVAVWAGDFRGRALRDGATGITGAAPLAHDVLATLYGAEAPSPWPRPPALVARKVCALSGGAPGVGCPHRTVGWAHQADAAPCAWHGPAGELTLPPELSVWARDRRVAIAGDSGAPRVVRPTEGARYRAGPDRKADVAFLVAGVATYALWLDGRYLGPVMGGRPSVWPIPEGRHRFTLTRTTDNARVQGSFEVEGVQPIAMLSR